MVLIFMIFLGHIFPGLEQSGVQDLIFWPGLIVRRMHRDYEKEIISDAACICALF